MHCSCEFGSYGGQIVCSASATVAAHGPLPCIVVCAHSCPSHSRLASSVGVAGASWRGPTFLELSRVPQDVAQRR
eukprot:3259719-Pyramimonas_sp.AAC.1